MTISTVVIDETNNIVNLVSGAQVITATANELAAIQAAASPSASNPFITDSAADSLISTHAALVNGVHGLTTNISAALAAAASPSASNAYLTATLAPTGGTGKTLRAINWSGIDSHSRNWNENLATWVNTGGGNNNNTWQFGYNNAVGGGGVDATEPSFYIQMESNYNPSATPHAPLFEYHLNFYAAGSSSAIRPFQYNATRDGSYIEHLYNADKYNWSSRSGAQWATLENGGFSLVSNGFQVSANDVVALKQMNAAGGQVLNIAYIDNLNDLNLGGSGVGKVFTANNFQVNGDIDHYGSKVGFFGVGAVSKPTGVAVTADGIHAALVTLGLIAA